MQIHFIDGKLHQAEPLAQVDRGGSGAEPTASGFPRRRLSMPFMQQFLVPILWRLANGAKSVPCTPEWSLPFSLPSIGLVAFENREDSRYHQTHNFSSQGPAAMAMLPCGAGPPLRLDGAYASWLHSHPQPILSFRVRL